VERSFPLIGETVDSARLAEVVDLLRATPGVRLVGRGQAGVIAAYAALLQPQAVREVVLLDPPASHRDGPHFLNVLRVLDIPVALGLLAPDVTLTLIGASDPAFDTTAALYTLAGAKDKLTRVSSPTN
jgi:pimeloyl-ACP methyl ester carboxylesterase